MIPFIIARRGGSIMPCGCYSLSFSRASTGSTFQRDVHPGEPLEFSRTKPLEFSRTKLAYIYIYKEEGRMRHEQNKASRASIYIYIYTRKKEEWDMNTSWSIYQLTGNLQYI